MTISVSEILWQTKKEAKSAEIVVQNSVVQAHLNVKNQSQFSETRLCLFGGIKAISLEI